MTIRKLYQLGGAHCGSEACLTQEMAKFDGAGVSVERWIQELLV